MQGPESSHPCFDFSPFCVALTSFKYPSNTAMMETGGKSAYCRPHLYHLNYCHELLDVNYDCFNFFSVSRNCAVRSNILNRVCRTKSYSTGENKSSFTSLKWKNWTVKERFVRADRFGTCGLAKSHSKDNKIYNVFKQSLFGLPLHVKKSRCNGEHTTLRFSSSCKYQES